LKLAGWPCFFNPPLWWWWTKHSLKPLNTICTVSLHATKLSEGTLDEQLSERQPEPSVECRKQKLGENMPVTGTQAVLQLSQLVLAIVQTGAVHCRTVNCSLQCYSLSASTSDAALLSVIILEMSPPTRSEHYRSCVISHACTTQSLTATSAVFSANHFS